MAAAEEKFGPKLSVTIVYCSSEDANFPTSELQRHTAGTNGWQSAQQCDYPVELGFRFDGEVTLDFLRILSHESKITSKLEVFICEATPEDRSSCTFPPYEKAIFRRLGHIKFSSNEDKDFEARELKTVNVHRDVLYLKLLLRQCHHNAINVFNQVGIVALSVHGHLLVPYQRPAPGTAVDQSLELIMNAQGAADEVPIDQMTPQKSLATQSGGGGGGASKGDAPTAADDEFDPITARKIKELTIHKARAVSEEDYDLAKALRDMIVTLKANGKRIAALEHKKRLAVEAEDYDAAKMLKHEIEALRSEALRRPAPAAQAHKQQSASRQAAQPITHLGNDEVPVAAAGASHEPFVPQAVAAQEEVTAGDVGVYSARSSARGGPPQAFDDRPAMAAQQQQQQQQQQQPRLPFNHDERPAVAQTPASLDDILKQGDTGGLVVGSKPTIAPAKTAAYFSESMPPWERGLNAAVVALSESQPPADALAAPKLAEYKEYITAFGTYVTACFFCKRWQLREAAIRAIMSSDGFDALVGLKGSSSVAVCASLLNYLTSKGHGVQDTISQVFFATCDALKKIIAQETQPAAPVTQLASPIVAMLPDLMLKAGDSNQRIREHATSILMLIATSPLGAERVSVAALAEPENPGKRPLNHRVHVARTHTVGLLLERIGLSRREAKTGLTVDGVMTRLCLPCLQHPHQDVREGAMDIVVQLHHIAGASHVAPFLNDVKPAQRALIEEQLAKGAPAPSKSAAREQEMASSSFSVAGGAANPVLDAAREAKRLQGQQPQAGKREKTAGGTGSNESGSKAQQQQQKSAKKNPVDESKTCQFCGKYDKRFNEATLDVHYVRTCPMLCPCPLCGQVTEIAALQDHLVSECDRKSLVRKCPICHEAVRAEDLDAHVAAKACIAAKPAEYSICPLCHAKLAPGENGWMQHLLQAPGCRNNPRRWDGGNGEEFQ